MKKQKRDWWFWLTIVLFTAIVIVGIAGCGELLKSGGHLAKGVGDASTALGEHMIETVAK